MASGTEKLGNSARRLGDEFQGLGSNFKTAFKTAFEGASGAGGTLTNIALAPVRWTMNAARLPVSFVSGTVKRFPKISVATTVLGGAVLVGSWLRGRGERDTQAAVADQIAMANQQAAMMAAARQQQSQQNPYCLAPGEFDATVAHKMRGGEPGTPTVGHGERVQAARLAAAEAANQSKPKMDVAAL